MLVTIEIAEAGVHARFGPHNCVFAFANSLEGEAVSGDYVTDWQGSPLTMHSGIVLHAGPRG
jgi:hypothetical protein